MSTTQEGDLANLLIWWTNEPQCKAAAAMHEAIKTLPPYLAEELDSRYGRNGRGRLWVPDRFGENGEIKVDPWPDTLIAKKLEQYFGGIVFHREDLPIVRTYPGGVTDLDLNPIESI
jgi:hypothetical protein